jgi:hypothetical protein
MKASGLDESLLKMGYSTEEINNGMASYIGIMGRTGRAQSVQNLSTEQLTQQSATYLKELDALAKITGQTRSEKQKEFDDLSRDAQFRAATLHLSEQERMEMMSFVNSFPKEAQGAVKDMISTGTASTDMLSIETICSEFDPANVLAPFDEAFEKANLEQLADAMRAQIVVFGQENIWMPNVFLMNFTDFVKYRNLKDANGNKLIHTLSDNVATIAGMTVITHPLVAPNTCYVLDTNQGEILDRQMLTVKTSFENKDNIEHEVVTLVAVERLQFHVALINRDAFMKCTDVAQAITDITAPVA